MKRFLPFVITALVASQAWSDSSQIKFPEDYRATFTNYLSLDRVQNHDQIIRLFANDIALKGPGDDGKLPYGSVIVAEIYKAKKDANDKVIESQLGRRIRDKFALVAIMERRKGWGKAYAKELRNDDWDFATFKPDGSAAEKDLNACRACHAPLTDTHHLFSYEHLK